MLDYKVDFSTRGKMGPNLTAVGDYINRIQNHGSSAALADTIVKLVYDPTMKDYKADLSQLAPDFYGEHQAELIRNSQRFGSTLLEGGPYQFGSKENLLWFDIQNAFTAHNAYDDYKTVHQITNGATVGYKREFADAWTAGLGFSIADNSAAGYNNRWTSDGNRTTRRQPDPQGRSGGILRIALLKMEPDRLHTERRRDRAIQSKSQLGLGGFRCHDAREL